ncbi:MAG: TolC family protein [Candidatus Obscuribacterales bacterium]
MRSTLLILLAGFSLHGVRVFGADMQMAPDMQMPPGMQMSPGTQMGPVPGAAPQSSMQKPAPPAAGGTTLGELESLALKNNPTLVESQAQIAGERGKALQAGLFPNPALGYVGDLLGVKHAPLGEFEGGMLGQEVILGGKLKYSRKKYQARVSAAEQQATAQQLRVLNDVRILYYRVMAARERLVLKQELLKTAKDRWLTTHEMRNQGQANQADVHSANIDLEKHKAETIMFENELALAWQQLTTVIGITREYGLLDGNLLYAPAEVAWDPLWKKLLADSPELGEAKMKLRADELTVQREKRQMIPNLVLCGGAGYDQIDKSFAARAGVTVTNIPLFNRNQGTIQQAEADLRRQHAQVKLVELDLRRRLAYQYWRYKTAAQFVKSYHEVIVPEARARYEVVLRSYMDTRLEWPAVLEAQKGYADARLQYIDHLLACREADIELGGFLLTGGLIAPPGVTPPGHIDATPQPR